MVSEGITGALDTSLNACLVTSGDYFYWLALRGNMLSRKHSMGIIPKYRQRDDSRHQYLLISRKGFIHFYMCHRIAARALYIRLLCLSTLIAVGQILWIVCDTKLLIRQKKL